MAEVLWLLSLKSYLKTLTLLYESHGRITICNQFQLAKVEDVLNLLYKDVGPNDLYCCMEKVQLTNKRYSGDNRLILLKNILSEEVFGTSMSAITSCRCNSLQGFGCSRLKVVRELGSERVRQFGPIYLVRRIKELFRLVREEWRDGNIVFELFKKDACQPLTNH